MINLIWTCDNLPLNNGVNVARQFPRGAATASSLLWFNSFSCMLPLLLSVIITMKRHLDKHTSLPTSLFCIHLNILQNKFARAYTHTPGAWAYCPHLYVFVTDSFCPIAFLFHAYIHTLKLRFQRLTKKILTLYRGHRLLRKQWHRRPQ